MAQSLHVRAGTQVSAAGTSGDQRVKRGANLFELPDLAPDLLPLGDRLHAHVGAVDLPARFQSQKLFDLTHEKPSF
jgi:hypothetical protein